MNAYVRNVLHIGRIVVTILGKCIAGAVPKDKQLILFSAWFGKKYLDSSRYMYEYFLKNKSNYRAVWYTKDKSLYNQLKKENKPVVYGHSVKGIWMQVRAIMLVSSVEFFDYNIYLVSNCILLDLDHGFPIKQSGFEIPTYNKRSRNFDRLLRWNVKLYKSASSEFVKNILSNATAVSSSKFVFCNKPRIDSFYDENLRKGNNEIIDKLKGDYKAIVYMPTHRKAGKKTIDVDKIFDLDKIQAFCEENDSVFLIKKHYYHSQEVTNLEGYSRIFDVSHEKLEVQTLLYQADALVSDYSAAYIDYLILDRPVIFYAYDYENFMKNERDLYVKLEDNEAGYKAYDKDEFIHALKSISFDGWQDKQHAEGRKKMKKLYFDDSLPEGNTRECISQIMEDLISGMYKSKWK